MVLRALEWLLKKGVQFLNNIVLKKVCHLKGTHFNFFSIISL